VKLASLVGEQGLAQLERKRYPMSIRLYYIFKSLIDSILLLSVLIFSAFDRSYRSNLAHFVADNGPVLDKSVYLSSDGVWLSMGSFLQVIGSRTFAEGDRWLVL
jgi:hypothetical protein